MYRNNISPGCRSDHRRLGVRSAPTFILPAALALFLVFGLGPNVEVSALACAVLVAGTYLLWRPGEPQILLFLFAFQWLQPSVILFYANLRGETLVDFMPRLGLEQATTLVLVGLLFLALGIRLGAGKQKASRLSQYRQTLDQTPAIRWLQLYLVMLMISTAALILAKAAPGLSQPLLAISHFKWGTFLIFTISIFVRPSSYRVVWLAIFAIEFIMGIGGYFSSFKLVFLYTLIAMTAINLRISAKQVISGMAVSISMILVGLYWTAIKPEYRAFVNGGTGMQIVGVSQGEALSKAVELASEVTSSQLFDSADALTRRFSEIDVFSAVIVHVPEFVPHEFGTLWLDSIARPFMPRILFPDKAIIDESEVTNRYSSVRYSGMIQGTQVSMGYIADSYVDFGSFGMMIMIFVFGYFIGACFSWLFNQPNELGLLGLALASVSFIQLTSIGVSSTKLVGSLVVSLIMSGIILKIIAPRFIHLLQPVYTSVKTRRKTLM
jgi:hypothetical protein